MEFELGGAFVETLQARINAVFPGVVKFPWFQQWSAVFTRIRDSVSILFLILF
jgi:hypothetical protein